MIEIRNNTMSKKGSVNSSAVDVSLVNNQRKLPLSDYNGVISQAEQYNTERENCNIIRLVVTINPMCSNVLFNRVTEVAIDEGSDECQCLNYLDNLSVINSKLTVRGWNGKPINLFQRETDSYGSIEFTRDTQLTGEGFGINYKPGLDIFNNHLLRSKTFKMVCDTTNKKKEFNTILDLMREFDGTQVNYYTDADDLEPMHLYLKEDILDYDEAVDTKLDEDGGWMGFVNAGKILTYDTDGKNTLPINRVINNQPACAFIDLSPERTLWYLTPKFNEARNRFENNWNYCLTYPYSSTTRGISFIRSQSNSLKIYYFDDTVSVAGVSACKIATFCKHGLQAKDTINLYVNGSDKNEDGDTIIRNVTVLKVIDEYTFYAKYSDSNWFYNTNFVAWENSVSLAEQLDPEKYVWDMQSRNNLRYKDDEGNTHVFTVFVDENGNYKANIDTTSNDISFKQVYNGEEVEYYVRLFRRLPNWKFAETVPNGDMTDEEIEELIKKYSTKQYGIDSNLSNLSFAKNAYGDDISQIVFTDDINISGLKDNLGRPLTDIYLTLIKNNAGYREWYGKNGAELNTSGDTIEYSHVFGKISCAFELSPATVLNPSHQNILQTNNSGGMECFNGLDISEIMDTERPAILDEDEIEFNPIGEKDSDDYYDGDNVFYGDLCLYSPATIAETVLDDIWFRFNTAQRELNPNDTSYKYLSSLAYDYVESDDYDNKGFQYKVIPIDNACAAAEGYKYHPHYRIPIKSISRQLYTATPHIVDVETINYENNDNEEIYTILTVEPSYNERYDSFVIYNPYRDQYYNGVVTEVISTKMFKCTITPETGSTTYMFDDTTYKVIRKQETIPDNAILLKDGSLLYAWRDINQNGFDPYSVNEVYPFTNGALYIEKNMRLFVKRQDPDRLLRGLFGNTDVNDVEPNHIDTLNENSYYNDMSCFNEPDFSNIQNNTNQVINAVGNMF